MYASHEIGRSRRLYDICCGKAIFVFSTKRPVFSIMNVPTLAAPLDTSALSPQVNKSDTNAFVTSSDPWPRPYYFEDGLRRVAPYFYTYNTFCKARWQGREILDVFVEEFRDRSLEYYVRTIKSKRKLQR